MSRIVFSLLTAALLLTACTGSQGPLGPEGAQGSQGATGQTGAAGQNGADGKDGATGPAGQTGATGQTGAAGQNGAPGSPGPTGPQGPMGTANVQQFNLKAPSNIDDNVAYYSIPGFTQAQLDSSIILAYFRLSSGSYWVSTPGPTGKDYYTTRADYISGSRLVVAVGSYVTATNNLYPSPLGEFRIIVIPASSITSLSLHGPNLNDYNAVKAYYHLGD